MHKVSGHKLGERGVAARENVDGESHREGHPRHVDESPILLFSLLQLLLSLLQLLHLGVLELVVMRGHGRIGIGCLVDDSCGTWRGIGRKIVS